MNFLKFQQDLEKFKKKICVTFLQLRLLFVFWLEKFIRLVCFHYLWPATLCSCQIIVIAIYWEYAVL